MSSDGGDEGTTPTGVIPTLAAERTGRWRTHPWRSGIVSIAAAALLAAVFLAGYGLGRARAPGPVTAAGAPSKSGATSPTGGPTGPTTTPTTRLTPLPGSANPTPVSSSPAAGSSAIPASGLPAFEAFTSAECELAAAPDYTCTTVLVAQFTGGESAPQYAAQVTFAATGVTVATSTDGKPEASVVQLATGGSFGVSMGELSFPATGAYDYTVTVTDTVDGQSATWQGTLPVGT